ncbi:UDP-galactose-lipid carrier transferase [Candidatus Terasakiella magnetica]|uniref:UDP-galactose-lipid carrier transferase n=1 Tax=Candidatus Terasakiella magnetica TaxID=1867952 RepID=A0A1C3RJA4_9PROT|nr:polyphosphate:AMP phosphotransferase [Candidatus Terasakiella magnetica]SCA57352.1 UDP-galactose-lipid carrier transferase [Candidatus Terasakiella magnetica]
MFETAELGRSISKKEFEAEVQDLRTELLGIQQDLRQCDFPVVIVMAGVDGAGKGTTVNSLNEWMDSRWIDNNAYVRHSDEESERPPYWRYWRDLPPKGKLGIFLSSWYSSPLLDNVYGTITKAEYDEKLDRIKAFEKTLADDGALILKFWMHLGKDEQKKRLKKLEKDELQSWRVNESDWNHWRLYDQFIDSAERLIMRTSKGHAPWSIVEGVDPRYASLTVAKQIRDAIVRHIELRKTQKEALAQLKAKQASEPEVDAGKANKDAPVEPLPYPTVLSSLDMSQKAEKAAYKTELKALQGRLNMLSRKASERGVSTVLVFEGSDAAGKGGNIRRITTALDARSYKVLPFAAPNDDERAHHYLWRFWRHMSRAGRMTIFDRSWYGRVLVERCEGFAREDEWRRAYGEIVDFEDQIVDHGTVLLKFWIHIDPDEQLARFKAREVTPWKQWKLTDEDWRNREKWALYEEAVNDLVEKTSTSNAPWTLVEGNDKKFARLKVLRSVCDALEARLAKK